MSQFPCRAKISGSYKHRLWEYVDGPDEKSQFYWPPGEYEWANPDEWYPNEYWWAEGNFSCDCNRAEFLPEGVYEEPTDGPCGSEICIDVIEPLEKGPNGEELPTLFLHETDYGDIRSP